MKAKRSPSRALARILATLPLALFTPGHSLAAEETSAADRPLLADIERSFRSDFLVHWYPRVLDWEEGGYLSQFDADWNPIGAQDKFIVSQARHLWMTSQLAMNRDGEGYRKMADHGFRYLADFLWDEEFGGFYSLLSRSGRILESEKSAYGNAFGIYALSSYCALTGDPEALELVKEAFLWLEKHSWDHEFDGYVDKLQRDGSWSGRSPEKTGTHPSEHIGLKDYNSSIHLLEALTALYQVWGDELVRERLNDMLVLVRDRFTTEHGYLRLYFYRNWSPVSHKDESRSYIVNNASYDHVSWGHDVETAFLMLEASHALGLEGDHRTPEVAKKMVDHALATGWDSKRGGFFESGYYFEGDDKPSVLSEEKVWWVAAEAMNALLMMSQLFPAESLYYAAFLQQWDYNKHYLIDQERGGWYAAGIDSEPHARSAPKAHIWKASYHDGRAYMNCIKMLKGEFELTRHRE